jgi:hypothetical protein
MSVSGSTIVLAQWEKIGDLVFVTVQADVTTTGTPHTIISMTLPVADTSTGAVTGMATPATLSIRPMTGQLSGSGGSVAWRIDTNWPNGTHTLRANFFYKAG